MVEVGDAVRFVAPGRKPTDAVVVNTWEDGCINLEYAVVYPSMTTEQRRREFRVPPLGAVSRDYGWTPPPKKDAE